MTTITTGKSKGRRGKKWFCCSKEKRQRRKRKIEQESEVFAARHITEGLREK